MIYQKLKTNTGLIIIKDADEPDLEGLMHIYKTIFVKHNIFQKGPEEVSKYLMDSHCKHTADNGGFIVAKLDNKTVGGILVRKQGEDLFGKHLVYKYNHVGVGPDYAGRGIGRALMNAADAMIRNVLKKQKFRTAKIEVHVSENEKAALQFYKKFDFEVEGRIKSHYRHGELVYFMGKEMKATK